MFPDRLRDPLGAALTAVALAVVLIGLGLAYQAVGGGAATRLVTVMLIDAIIVLGIQIYIGNTGILSFGHIGFGGIAGYVFAVTTITPAQKAKNIPKAPFGLGDIQLNPAVGMLVAVLVTVAIAAVVGIGLARSGAESGAVAATVITLALLFVVHNVAVSWPELTGGERAGISWAIGTALTSRWPIYVLLVLAIFVARLFNRSRSGRLAVAAREDNLAARAMGIQPLTQQTIALLISVAVVALGASLKVWQNGALLPGDFFFDYTLLTLVMLIVGGRNSATGAVVGVVTITVVREISRQLGGSDASLFGLSMDAAPLDWVFRPNLQAVVLGLMMLGFMIWRPMGMLGDWEVDKWALSRWWPRNATEPTEFPEEPANRQASLEASDVRVVFGGFTALDGASLRAGSGEIVGIIGPNGAGKTTMVNVMTGMVPPTEGSVAVDGADVTNAPSYKIARAGLVRTFQNLRLFQALTIRENIEVSTLVAAEHRPGRHVPTVDELVAAADLWEFRDRRASQLDYGNCRRLELARAAGMAPDFLLLDEPTSGMSDAESVEMIEQVRKMAALVGAGVVVIDHDLNFITGICHRIYCFDQGRVIAEGSPAEIRANPRVQAAYLGSSGAANDEVAAP